SSVREFGQRVAALISIAGAEWCAEVIGGDSLKAIQMFSGRLQIPFALVGAGDAELGRGMEWKCRQGLFEFGDGVVVLLLLRQHVADEVVAVGIGSQLGDMLEGGDALFGVSGILVDEAEVIPGPGILREFARRLFKRGTSLVQFLLA